MHFKLRANQHSPVISFYTDDLNPYIIQQRTIIHPIDSGVLFHGQLFSTIILSFLYFGKDAFHFLHFIIHRTLPSPQQRFTITDAFSELANNSLAGNRFA